MGFMNMRPRTRILLCVTFLTALVYVTNVPSMLQHAAHQITRLDIWQTDQTDPVEATTFVANPNKTIVILMWTTWFDRGVGNSRLTECPKQNCILVQNRSMLNESDAVVFHSRDIRWNDVPKYRRSDQDFVFFNLEPPYRTGGDFDADWKKYYFNATMTYRRDSDIYAPYGFVVNRTTPLRQDLKALAASKTKVATQLVSNCHTPSGRELLVEKLQSLVQVDVYGQCGKLRCGNGDECANTFERDYKFYLSLENSECVDYISEKFFARIHRSIVPIVMQRKNFEKFLPEYRKPWFVALDDFKNSRELAAYLKYLHGNVTAYYEYLSWHEHYETAMHVNSDTAYMPRKHWCDLCAFTANKKRKRKTRNVYEWWWNEGACDNMHKFFHDYTWFPPG